MRRMRSAGMSSVEYHAGGGWADRERKKHYSVPLYSTADMKSQFGELETGAFPSGCAFHPVRPLVFACTGKQGSVFIAKSYAAGQKFTAPLETRGAATASVLAFVGKGRKLAWGTSSGGRGVLKFYDLERRYHSAARGKAGRVATPGVPLVIFYPIPLRGSPSPRLARPAFPGRGARNRPP